MADDDDYEDDEGGFGGDADFDDPDADDLDDDEYSDDED